MTYKSEEIKFQWLKIPEGSGNQYGKFDICADSSDPDGKIRKALSGLYLCEKSSGWNFPEADDYYLSSMQLVNTISREYMNIILQDYNNERSKIAKILLHQSLIVGVHEKLDVNNPVFIANCILKPWSKLSKNRFDDDWNNIQFLEDPDKSIIVAREKLLNRLLNISSSFQQGDNKYALDITGVFYSMRLQENYNNFSDELKTHAANYREDRLKNAASKLKSKLQKFSDNYRHWTDANFDQKLFMDEMKTLLSLSQETGTWPIGLGDEYSKIIVNLEFFISNNPSTQIELVESLSKMDENNLNEILFSIGKINLNIIKDFDDLFSKLKKLVDGINNNITGKEKTLAQVNPDQHIAQIQSGLNFFCQMSNKGSEV